MTQEDKELVLRDLCARLPYGVKVKVTRVQTGFSKDETLTYNRMYTFDEPDEYITIKPYLRPLSSMTEEEMEEYNETFVWSDKIPGLDSEGHNIPYKIPTVDSSDWLIKNMFDFRGLIPKGLADYAKEGMYKL